jgi:hypothetical protein
MNRHTSPLHEMEEEAMDAFEKEEAWQETNAGQTEGRLLPSGTGCKCFVPLRRVNKLSQPFIPKDMGLFHLTKCVATLSESTLVENIEW